MITIEILPRPEGREDRGPELWIDEAIWGHRLHDEQSPWLTLLEFLGIFNAARADNQALKESRLNTLAYRPQTQLHLRNILFNNPHIASVLAEARSEDAMWEEWTELMKANAGGITGADFKYVRQNFESFSDFAAITGFLQSSAIEGNSNKRWTSKFVFPFGGSALYEDVSVSASGGVTTDRRFFGRTGEVLYLMLARSRHAPELAKLLTERLFEHRGPYDALAKALQGTPQLALNERAGSYLPVTAHRLFDQMAEDWISVLQLDMPAYDALPHIVAITGLHLVLYQLSRARQVLGGGEVKLVCEIIAPRKTLVREISANSYQLNNTLPQQAMEAFILDVKSRPEWQAALGTDQPVEAAAAVLDRQFDWPDVEDRGEAWGSPEELLNELVRRANIRHKQHVARVHGTWLRQIGLASRRASRRTRYAPTDRLLKSLVVTMVNRRLEFREFLAELDTRYGLVIGERQARDYIARGEADQEDFSDNAHRLEERLRSLGLLERLSDSCAYVINPYSRAEAA
jgi:hypothetical protein